MCGEGQVSRLYKYNGPSPRMFHTAWHFHYLKPHRHSAGSNLPQIYMWLNATHAPDLAAGRPLMILVEEQMTERTRLPQPAGMFMNGRNVFPVGWGGRTKELIQTPIPSRLDAFTSHRMRHSQKSTWFHPNPFPPPSISASLSSAFSRRVYVLLSQQYLKIIWHDCVFPWQPGQCL